MLDRSSPPPGAGAPASGAGQTPATAAGSSRPPAGHARVAVVGMSNTPTCGARDHATLLAQALAEQGVECSMHWLQRREDSLRGGRAEVSAWARQLAAELRRGDPQAILLHYSIFAYSHRGLPLFVPPVLRALRRSRLPVITVMHEYAFPWRRSDWRGNVWALTQRAVLLQAMRLSRAVVVTTGFRADWLRSRPWLPRRPLAVAPVFSNLPAPARAPSAAAADGSLIGIFGYPTAPAAAALVLAALARLLEGGLRVQLRLLGAPGPASQVGQMWQAAARRRGVAEALSFTGTLPAQELSDAIAGCDVLLFADPPGPSSRKGSLAGALASGRPLVAVDGPRRWGELVQAGAVQLVAPSAEDIAQALGGLLADRELRERLGARGRAFAQEQMGIARTTATVLALLGQLQLERSPAPA